jgi:hypothetical protein
VNKLQYKDEPDYSFIRGKLKQIFERTQSICRFNSRVYDQYDDNNNTSFRGMGSMYSPAQFPAINDLNVAISRPFKYVKDNLQSQMFPQYTDNKTFMAYPHQNEVDNQYNMTKALNQCFNPNIGFSLPSQAMPPPNMRGNMQKPHGQEYDQQNPANNLNLSLNQLLGLPYQIVMPQTEINQSISINNLPSLNDLALRTGINAGLNPGMGPIYGTPRPVSTPSPVPLTTPQLILPLSSLYSTNCSKDHLQLPIPILDREYIDQINTAQTHSMHSKPQSQHSYLAPYPTSSVNNNILGNYGYGKIISEYCMCYTQQSRGLGK